MKAYCILCKSEFITSPFAVKRGRGKFCSKDCHNKSMHIKHMGINKKECAQCGKEIYPSKCLEKRNQGKFCSRNCWKIWHKAENTGAWKGGVSKIDYRIRRSTRYKTWRDDIFKRDNFSCQRCGQRGGVLNAHHVKMFKDIIAEATSSFPGKDLFYACIDYDRMWELSNGITLCEKCHKGLHNEK